MTQDKGLTHQEIARYSRHLVIPDVGLEGQVKLKESNVLVVGAGGLGSPILLYLAAAGVGHLGIVEYDLVDESNLQRQVLHSVKNVGKSKAESARERLLDLNPLIRVDLHTDPIAPANALDVIRPYDIVVDAVDNLPARYLMNDACILLGKPLVYGSISRFDGQVSVFDSRQDDCPCYRCVFPEPPPPELVLKARQNGVIGVLPGVIGTLEAAEVVKLITGIGKPLRGKLLLYDMLDANFMAVTIRRSPTCPSCGKTPPLTELGDYEAFCKMPGSDLSGFQMPAEAIPSVGVDEVKAKLGSDGFTLLDIRGQHEWRIADIAGALHIPEEQLFGRLGELSKGDEIVVFCRTSNRSQKVARKLASAGFSRVSYMKGGLNEWAEKIDSEQPIY